MIDLGTDDSLDGSSSTALRQDTPNMVEFIVEFSVEFRLAVLWLRSGEFGR